MRVLVLPVILLVAGGCSRQTYTMDSNSMAPTLAKGESVSVDLENPVQGFKVWRRARVQYVKPCAEEGFRVGCVLSNRLTPREVRGLKSPAGAMPGEFKRHRAKTGMHELGDSQPVR